MQQYYVYILASKKNGTLYVGVTNDLIRRVYEHKNNLVGGFTKKYRVKNLVYFEACEDIRAAIQREKNIKKWKRQWKIDLIEKNNPDWKDLYSVIVDGFPLSRE
ncbi:MAG: GIY-YIG nuclease family protein [Deltaproteobacteria bacterium]|nr:GIY-YIG nuclease family protein [Deltaproteobacteria bacterium]